MQDQLDFSQAIELEACAVTVWSGPTLGGQGWQHVASRGHGGPVSRGPRQPRNRLGHAGLKLSDLVQRNYFTTDIPAFLGAVPVVGRSKAAGCKPTSSWYKSCASPSPDWMIELEAMAVA